MKLLNKYLFSLVALVCLLACSKTEENTSEKRLFQLLPVSDSGIDFKNTITETDSLNILDYLYFYNGGGVALGDINNDGLVDIYFSANQEKNKLYLNKGNLTFEDITENAGVAGTSDWNTGVVIADVNADGWLDIYSIAVVGINGFKGYNELFINNGDGTFTENAKAFNLDLQTYGTHAAFLDYDLDGDLDLYVLNHAVHTQESFGKVSLRNTRNEKTGDRLLRNDNGTFTEVSENAGIYGGINAYGLGISVADFNQDGYPDLYIGNDFHEDDYYYLNNGDGTFTESLRNYFGHTSRFSMGNDVADINHDGYPDLISLDMLPEDERVIKSSEGDDLPQTLKLRTQQYGYHYQFSRNMLYSSQPNGHFLETALLSGVAATDWSWSALFGDYDLDGMQDLFISNGIPKRPNDLDYIKFISNNQIQSQLNSGRLVDQEALEMMPSGKVANYFFKGNNSLQFKNVSQQWTQDTPSLSGASAWADLDNDGDLDIVTNNSNDLASIYINTSSETANYLNLTCNYSTENSSGLGTKVYCYSQGHFQYKELYPSHGFQASSQPLLNFGLGSKTVVDSVVIIWPNKTKQVLKNVPANQLLSLQPENTSAYIYPQKNEQPLFNKVAGNLGIDFTHKEDDHSDFNYQKLIPYQVSDRGPALAIGDLNLDGKDDIFIGGARNQKAGVFLQTEKGFERTHIAVIENDSLFEDVAAEIITPTFSKNPSISVLSGGNTITSSIKNLEDRWYPFTEDWYKMSIAYEFYENSSVIISNEAHTFLGNHSIPLSFGDRAHSMTSDSRGNQIVFENNGFVTDALFTDFNNDGIQDLIVVGEWMPPRFYELKEATWIEVFPVDEKLNGLWQRIHPFDMDGDGDLDYVLGNWGTNTKFKASTEAPMQMYYADFDQNSTTETVVAIEKEGNYYPLLGLDDLASQMVFLRKKFNTYQDFAGKTMEEIFENKLQEATLFEVHTLASGYLQNDQGSFRFVPFQNELQISPLQAFCAFDFDQDGKEELLVGGNYFGVIPFHGRFDTFPGAMIESDNEIQLGGALGLDFSQKSVRHLAILQLDKKPYLLAVYNNDKTEVYAIEH